MDPTPALPVYIFATFSLTNQHPSFPTAYSYIGQSILIIRVINFSMFTVPYIRGKRIQNRLLQLVYNQWDRSSPPQGPPLVCNSLHIVPYTINEKVLKLLRMPMRLCRK